MTNEKTVDRYAVMGHPVAHSRSPFIHAEFARQTGQDLVYSTIDVAPGSFPQQVKAFFASGGRGLNVTVPYKEEAWQLVQVRSSLAESAGAVNTLFGDERGRLHGANTDGIGLVRDIVVNHAGTIAGQRILILGAGGAVRGVLAPILQQAPAALVIANRTLAKAEELAALGRDEGADVQACDYSALDGFAESGAFDLIINGTSASLHGDLPPLPDTIVGRETWCYDMMYGPGETAFQAWARERQAARALDGAGMLVEQAAEAFALWRGVRPKTGAVLESLRTLLGEQARRQP